MPGRSHPGTSAPQASITPPNSLPAMNGVGGQTWYPPRAINKSTNASAVASTTTRTSCAWGSGQTISSRRKPSELCNSCTRRAFIGSFSVTKEVPFRAVAPLDTIVGSDEVVTSCVPHARSYPVPMASTGRIQCAPPVLSQKIVFFDDARRSVVFDNLSDKQTTKRSLPTPQPDDIPLRLSEQASIGDNRTWPND